MKIKFNIKKISILLVTLVCFAVSVNKVSAEEKYTCRYDLRPFGTEPTEEKIIPADKFLFGLNYENGNYNVGIYERDTNKKVVIDELFALRYAFFLDEGKTLEAIKEYDIKKEKKCPSLWILWVDNADPDTYFNRKDHSEFYSVGISFDIDEPNASAPYDGSGKWKDFKCTDEKVIKLRGDGSNPPCSPVKFDVEKSSMTTENGEVIDNKFEKKCTYTMASGSDLKDQLELKFNQTYVSAKYLEEDTKNLIITTENIDPISLNQKCPAVIYIDYSIVNDAGHHAYVSRPPGSKELNIYYLKQQFTVTDYEGENNKVSGCAAFGPTFKYVKGFFAVLRYIVPIIIIVLSVIQFLGVVFSGEPEKMEKAKKNFAIRLLVGVLILWIPFLLEVILKFANIIEKNQSIYDAVCNIF